MHSRLPIAIPPAHHEIAASYVARLATLHGMPCTELWHQVSRPRTPGSTSRTIAGDLLAAVTGLPESRLAYAVVELCQPEPDWLAYRHEPQRGCPRCTARHLGGPVLQLLPHHRYVCTRHRIWIGPPDVLDHPYPSLDGLPDVVAAQRAHLRLLRRLGPAATYDAVLTGFLICGHRWDQDAHRPDDARIAWHDRAAELIPPGTEQATFSASRLFAATYPEAVKVATLIGSLHWRRLAAGGSDEQGRFAAEIGRRLGDPDYRPRVTQDAIAHWIDQDCWQPSSLPVTTYRELRAYGGHTALKVNQHSRDRNQRSANWYAVNRRGGRGILYHRHLGPVLVRDWSPRMELFTGTVAASVNTSTFRNAATRSTTTDDAHELVNAEFLRPFPAPSDYLDIAATPAPWPVRATPRQPEGARPMLPHERRLTGRPQGNRGHPRRRPAALGQTG
jgi:TniQ